MYSKNAIRTVRADLRAKGENLAVKILTQMLSDYESYDAASNLAFAIRSWADDAAEIPKLPYNIQQKRIHLLLEDILKISQALK